MIFGLVDEKKQLNVDGYFFNRIADPCAVSTMETQIWKKLESISKDEDIILVISYKEALIPALISVINACIFLGYNFKIKYYDLNFGEDFLHELVK